MEHIFGNGWEITPAGGITGEAFYAQHENEKLFIKRNSSPFLAVLSAEGIVPKLVWTRRLENGDVVTAQKWIAGKRLEPSDMVGTNVVKLLKKIHYSKPLLSMLKRLGKYPVLPTSLVADLINKMDGELKQQSIISSTLNYLNNHLPNVHPNKLTVCHGDVNHNNWIITENNQLYLIDWEGALISDPALDLGPLLFWYVPENQWTSWLKMYGLKLDKELMQRLKWYVLYQTIETIILFKDRDNKEEETFWKQYLETIL
ncbi:phosphotransferase family protein [Bacillus kwashiorkori]|uniref:phosphotransferase family protein n=1 Tax=Bacillus kwashiorkori TaxID=1522318 RepID=UPI000780AC3D|nr:phosphotransferase family protein [Bacillus kwashiorkori]